MPLLNACGTEDTIIDKNILSPFTGGYKTKR
jgi:hypothetical protein